jgi:hypothetical protein
MRLKANIQYTVDVSGCPRCGEDHENLLFSKLTNPEGREDLWAFCPEKTEPLLISTEDLGG